MQFADHAHSYQDLAYGKKIVKLDNGEKIQMPNVVRTVTRSTMINQCFELKKKSSIRTLKPINITIIVILYEVAVTNSYK